MPTTPTISSDPTVEAHVFWLRFKTEIAGAILLLLFGLIGFGGYRLYSQRQSSAAAELLASAKTAQEYEQVMTSYPSTAAAASAHLLLAESQRKDGKFQEANTTLQAFVSKYPTHELISTAKMAMAANLGSMGKKDEALAMYQDVAQNHRDSYNAALALLSQVPLLKAKNQIDAARRACETVINEHPTSLFASDAMQQLTTLKPSPSASSAVPPANQPGVPSMLARPQSPAGGNPLPLPKGVVPSVAPTKKPK